MTSYLLTRRARRGILEIWRYIAQDSVQYADGFVEKLAERFTTLSRNPHAGRQRDDIRPGIRGFPFREYEILHRIGSPGVRIIAVVHGRRNLAELRLR